MMTSLVKKCVAKLDPNYETGGPIKKSGCRLSLRNSPTRHLIIDFDRSGSPLHRTQVRCDYLFIAEGQDHDGWVVPIELKKGALTAKEAYKQLSAGAVVAEKLVPSGAEVRFRPTAAFGNIHIAERMKLRRPNFSVECRGVHETIRLLKCGAPLKQVLS